MNDEVNQIRVDPKKIDLAIREMCKLLDTSHIDILKMFMMSFTALLHVVRELCEKDEFDEFLDSKHQQTRNAIFMSLSFQQEIQKRIMETDD